MTCEQMIKRLEPILTGLTVESFKLVAGGTLILYLTHGDTNRTGAQDVLRIWIESAWRICKNGIVVAGSLDSPALLMARLRELIGNNISSVQLNGIPGDISMILSSNILIESFSRSTQDEQWQIRRRDGLRLGLGENYSLYEEYDKAD
jgi:hypothetical protein